VDRAKSCGTSRRDIERLVVTHDDRSRGSYPEPLERAAKNRAVGFCDADIGTEDDGIE